MIENLDSYRIDNKWATHFARFLELSELKRFEVVFGCKLKWRQKLEFLVANRWFSIWRKANPGLRALDLWESMYKQRF